MVKIPARGAGEKKTEKMINNIKADTCRKIMYEKDVMEVLNGFSQVDSHPVV